jgi:hypothetical protein
MAGSIKWFEYTTDTGGTFAISMDESNGEAVENPDYTASSTVTFKLPGNVKKRFARYSSDDGLHVRIVPVCSPSKNVNNLPASFTAMAVGIPAGVTVRLRQFTGERISMIPHPEDTGLNDGDLT